MKIHAWIAKHSSISRRQAERYVEQGLVLINQEKAHVGQKVLGNETIKVRGQLIHAVDAKTRLLLLNKAPATVCSHQNENDIPSALEAVPKLTHGKWLMVGRLDVMTTGLLLITNDGDLAHHFAHPSHGYIREYLVRVDAELTDLQMKQLVQGIEMEEGLARLEKVTKMRKASGRNHWYKVVLKQGRYRMVRRLMASVGCEVSRLKRIRFGPFVLDQALGQGKFQEVDAKWLESYLQSKKR